MNVGLSRSLIRMNKATRISRIDARNGIRHTQPSRMSLGMVPRYTNTIAASRVPAWMPMNGNAAKYPRRSTGAYSAISTVDPACSAPAPKPWHSRRKTNRMGAQMPMVSKVGSAPTRVEEPPISKIVTTRTHLRPSLSPIVPKNRPPSGRATNPTPNVAKLATRAVPSSRLLKNNFEKIRAEASP